MGMGWWGGGGGGVTGLWQRVFLFMAVVTGSSKFSDPVIAILSFTLPFFLGREGGGGGGGRRGGGGEGGREWELGGGGRFCFVCFSIKITLHDSPGQTITGN